MSAKSTNSTAVVICATAYRTRAGTGILKTCYQDGSFDLEDITGLLNGDLTHRAGAGVNVPDGRCARCGGPVSNGAPGCCEYCESCKEKLLMGEPAPELPGQDLSVGGHDLSDNPNAGLVQPFPKGRWS